MHLKTSHLFIRVVTALSVTLSPLANAATIAAAPGEPERPKFNLATAPKRGHVLYGHSSPEGRPVHFEGQKDGAGRERVFSHIGEKNGMPIFRTGVFERNGKITWDGAFHSRGPGQNIYPNYPATADRVDELPRNRSLVPSGPVRTVPRGSGRSEINSPGREYLPEFDEANRPSRLRQTLDWSKEKSANLRQSVEDVINGKDKIVDFKKMRGEVAGRMDALKTPTVNFSQAAFAFYTALGFVAAFNLMQNYSHNPVAWDEFLRTLTDPVGWVALAGFMAGAAWFYKRIANGGANGGLMRQMPYFAGALIAGTMISTSVAVMAGNEDVQSCMGFTAYKKTGSFKRDHAACDRAYVWFTSSPEEQGMIFEIANSFVPVAVNVMGAGGLYLGTLHSAQFLANKVKMINALRSVPVMKSPRAGGILGTLVIGTAHMVLFLGAYEISSSVFGIEKGVREYLLADKGLFHTQYGTSLADAEKNLFTEWTRIKKNNWKDPNSWDKVCVDTNRKYQVLYNCDAPDQLDFVGVLNRYSKLQGSWRALQMQETLAAYEQWMRKLNNFNETVDVSYNFYKEALTRVQNGTLNDDILKAPVSTANEEILSRDVEDTWQRLFTFKLPEFLLASMACGPELDGYKGQGVWQSARRFVKENLPGGNAGPQSLIENATGFRVLFNPPRITAPLDGVSDTVCEQSASLLPHLFNTKYRVTQFPALSQGSTVYGLATYISQNIRPSLLSLDGGNNFDQWWSEKVMSQVSDLQSEFRRDYLEIVNGTYKKAVSRSDYRWCEAGKFRDAGLEKYIRRLSPAGEPCGPEAQHRLAYGVFNNLRDEMRLYLALTLDLYMSNLHRLAGPLPPRATGDSPRFANSIAEYENILIPRAIKVLEVFTKFTQQMTIASPSDRADVEALTEEAISAFNEFSRVVLAGSDSDFTALYQLKWTQELLDKTKQLFKDSLSYYNILTAFDRPADRP